MDGGNDPDCRRGMIFDPLYNKKEFDFVKRLIKIKHMNEFRQGDIRFIETESYLAYQRFFEEESVVILNLSDQEIFIEQYKGYFDLINEKEFDGHIEKSGVAILK